MKLYTQGFTVITLTDNTAISSVEWLVCHSMGHFREKMNEWTMREQMNNQINIDPDNGMHPNGTKPYLNHHWLTINEIQQHLFKQLYMKILSDINHQNEYKNCMFIVTAASAVC